MTDCTEARAALAAAANRTADLVESIGNVDLPMPDSEWTVGEAAAHLIFVLRGFTASAKGAFEEWEPIAPQLPTAVTTSERIAAVNRLFIPAEPRRSAGEAGRAITGGVGEFLQATASASPDQPMPTPWYGERESLTVGQATSLLLGEQVMHGRDIARAGRRKWPITRSDARLIMAAVCAMMPKLARPEALGDISATFRIHSGGKGDFVARCCGGAIAVEPPGQQPVDCHIVTDPVAFVLIGYGRIPLWRAIAGAKILSWGRRPWLAFRFPSFVSHP